MAITNTVVDFKAFLPEFKNTPDDTIQLYLDEATKSVDEDLFLDFTVQAIFYRAADMLSATPFGVNTKLASKTSTYLDRYNRLRLEVGGVGFRLC